MRIENLIFIKFREVELLLKIEEKYEFYIESFSKFYTLFVTINGFKNAAINYMIEQLILKENKNA